MSHSACLIAAPSMPAIMEDEVEIARRAKTPTGKEALLEDYPGLEPAILPTEGLFKFKGQDPLLRGDSSAGNIRAMPGAAAMSEVGVYHMAPQEMTFWDAPLNAAVSISPRSRLGRTSSSLGPGEADLQQSQSFNFADGRAYSSIERTRSSLDRTRSSLDRTRSSFSYADPATRSLMERTGSSIAQYDAQACLLNATISANLFVCTQDVTAELATMVNFIPFCCIEL